MRNIIQRETFADATGMLHTGIACSSVLGLRPTKEELSDQRALLLDNELPSHVCEMASGLLSDAHIVRKSGVVEVVSRGWDDDAVQSQFFHVSTINIYQDQVAPTGRKGVRTR